MMQITIVQARRACSERFGGYIEVPLIDEHGTHSVQAIQSSGMARDGEPCATKEWRMVNCLYPLSQRDNWTLSVANLMGSKDQVKRVGGFCTGPYGKRPDGMYYSRNRSHCYELALTPLLIRIAPCNLPIVVGYGLKNIWVSGGRIHLFIISGL